jgi:DNA-binding NarL/FixJ family response regulator
MSPSILLADDHVLFRDGLKHLLTAHGMRVVGEVANGEQAVTACRRLRPDLVVMDLSMPRLTGLEATRLIKAEWPEARVVIVTASESDHDLFEAVKSGASGYLLKSYPSELVIDYLEGAMEGVPALTPSLASKILTEFARLSSEPASDPATASSSAPPHGEAPQLVEPLTAREREVLERLVTGAPNKRIADELFITENTVKYHLKNILQKLHLGNRAQVVAYALRHGLTSKEPPAEPN